MHVIHLIGGGDTGGAKTHVLNLLKDLNSHIHAELYCFMKGDFSDEAKEMGIPIHVIDTKNPFLGIKQLRQLIGDQKVDLIHCHGARGNLMGTTMKRYLKCPVVTTVHSDYRLDYLGRPAARLSYGTTYMMALRKVNYYIGVSDPMTDILIDRNFPADKIYTIYNGIDFKTPIKTLDRTDFFRSIGFHVEADDVVAGIAARLSPVKDIPTLLQAMAKACTSTSHLKLIIAGDGEDREKLIAMAETLGISDKVCFTGWLNDINSFYNAIDINLLTSISETFPYALTEGTRMKCATIASNVGGVPVLIDDGINGLIFTPGDSDQLAAHLLKLVLEPDYRKRIGTLLYEKAARDFSIDEMVHHQIAIYESILERDRRTKERARDGIIICGAYGYGNAGDDAILQSIIASVKSIDAAMPITILAKNTKNIKKSFRVHSIYTFNMFSMIRAMRKSVLYINGGGSLIQNVTSSRSLMYYLFTLRMAKMLGNKVDMYGCGIGPVYGAHYQKSVNRTLNKAVDVITLRDTHSFNELQAFGINKPQILVTSDPALVLKPLSADVSAEFLNKHGIAANGNYACFMLRGWFNYNEKLDDLAKCVTYVYHTYQLIPVFISMNIQNDGRASHLVASRLSIPYHVIDEKIEPQMMMSLLSHMKLVFAMRLHGLIFASVSGIPLVGISYDPKINSFLDYLGYGECINLENVNYKALVAVTDRAAKNIGKEAELKQYAAQLAKKEKDNIRAVSELL